MFAELKTALLGWRKRTARGIVENMRIVGRRILRPGRILTEYVVAADSDRRSIQKTPPGARARCDGCLVSDRFYVFAGR